MDSRVGGCPLGAPAPGQREPARGRTALPVDDGEVGRALEVAPSPVHPEEGTVDQRGRPHTTPASARHGPTHRGARPTGTRDAMSGLPVRTASPRRPPRRPVPPFVGGEVPTPEAQGAPPCGTGCAGRRPV